MNFKHLYIDADKFIYAAANVAQTNGCQVTHKKSGRRKVFENKTKFKAWCKEEGWDADLFDTENIVVEVEPVPHACHTLKQMLKQFDDVPWAENVHFVIHGDGNYREQYATLKEYKGNRPPKPILYKEVKDYFTKAFKPILAKGEETDDYVAKQMYKGYLEAKKVSDKHAASVCIASEDKDLETCPGWLWNFVKEDEPKFITEKQANRNFLIQLLTGDNSDNIGGLNGITPDIIKKYGLRKVRGVGAKSAKAILDKSEGEELDAVVWCYKQVHKDKWEDVLRENAILLRMRREEGELFDIVSLIKGRVSDIEW